MRFYGLKMRIDIHLLDGYKQLYRYLCTRFGCEGAGIIMLTISQKLTRKGWNNSNSDGMANRTPHVTYTYQNPNNGFPEGQTTVPPKAHPLTLSKKVQNVLCASETKSHQSGFLTMSEKYETQLARLKPKNFSSWAINRPAGAIHRILDIGQWLLLNIAHGRGQKTDESLRIKSIKSL